MNSQNDDKQQKAVQTINDWMDKNPREAVELYLEDVGIEDSDEWMSNVMQKCEKTSEPEVDNDEIPF